MIERARVSITKNTDPSGDERLTAGGRVQVVTLSPPIDPSANGVTLVLADASGAVLFSRTLPPGLSTSSTIPGWRVNPAGTRWQFRDRSRLAAGGITAAVISHQPTRAPGRFTFTIKGTGAFQIQPDQLPLQVAVIFGTAAHSAAGQCGVRLFNPSTAVAPRCLLKRAGAVVTCR